MKRQNQKNRPRSGLANLLLIVSFFGLVGFFQTFSQATSSYALPALEIKGYHLVSENEGWLWLGDRLYWTKTGGLNWMEITPPTSDSSNIEAVFF